MTTNILTLIPYVRATRRFGSTYVHTAVRAAVNGWQGVEGSLDGQAVVATYSGYGRSLVGGGHKYKAHCRYVASGKPVPSRLLSSVLA